MPCALAPLALALKPWIPGSGPSWPQGTESSGFSLFSGPPQTHPLPASVPPEHLARPFRSALPPHFWLSTLPARSS